MQIFKMRQTHRLTKGSFLARPGAKKDKRKSRAPKARAKKILAILEKKCRKNAMFLPQNWTFVLEKQKSENHPKTKKPPLTGFKHLQKTPPSRLT